MESLRSQSPWEFPASHLGTNYITEHNTIVATQVPSDKREG